jgi:hypothetical protein
MMWARLIGLGMLAVGMPSALQAAGQSWTPDAKIISTLESVVKVPGGYDRPPLPLKSYARFYAGSTIKGRRVVRGEYVLSDDWGKPAGIHISKEEDFPAIMDGGCCIVNLVFDVKAGKIAWIECNGIA